MLYGWPYTFGTKGAFGVPATTVATAPFGFPGFKGFGYPGFKGLGYPGMKGFGAPFFGV